LECGGGGVFVMVVVLEGGGVFVAVSVAGTGVGVLNPR
jgi:hypothetical protein